MNKKYFRSPTPMGHPRDIDIIIKVRCLHIKPNFINIGQEINLFLKILLAMATEDKNESKDVLEDN